MPTSQRHTGLMAATIVLIAAAGRGLAACMLALSGVMAAEPPNTAQAEAATVIVDAATDLGALNNPAWYHNQTRSLGSEDLARVSQIGPARVVREWVKPASYYDETSGTYDFSGTYGALDNATSHADRLYLNFDQCKPVLMRLAEPQRCRDVLKTGIRHYKLRYPTLRYIEVFNEPDKIWPPASDESSALPVEDYYQWYKIAYAVVNEINQELAPDIPLLVGGPVTYRFNGSYLRRFLDLFAADPDPARQLGFIAYHEYTRRANPADVRTAKATIRSWLQNRGLNPDIPIVVSEYGVFPGSGDADSGHGPGTLAQDMLIQASAMATLGMFYTDGGMDMPMHWLFNHATNERKSMFVDGVPGAVLPYYNVVKMERMLRERRIAATSTALDTAGIGVNALATRDGSGIAVLMTNYQWTTGATVYDTALEVRNLPAEFAGAQILLDRYLLDATTSNYTHDPADAELRRIERRVLPPDTVARATFGLTPNATSLVVLTPLVQVEAEDLPTSSAGAFALDLPDAAASGGRFSKVTGARMGSVSYAVTVPRAGRYNVVVRIRDTPDYVTARLSVDRQPQGESFDSYSDTDRFRDVDLGVASFAAAGSKAFTFTLFDNWNRGWWTFGVDQITLIPLADIRVEAEATTPRVSPGDHVYYVNDSAAGGGSFVKLGANAVGDWIRMAIHVPASGTYRLNLAMKAFPNRGQCQVSVNGTPVGFPIDSYAPTSAFVTLPVGTVSFDQTGAATISCEVTGANPASTGYELAIDAVRLDMISQSALP
ncbi:MAG TPA: hypothetical protein VKB34_14625 [Povalibacter sp.]|nr:hypothetical protein [Povalibacter sp.]